MSLFTNPSPLYPQMQQMPVEVQQRWMQQQPLQPQQTQTDAYTEAINHLNNLNPTLKAEILNDQDFQAVKNQVDGLLLQYCFAQALPLVLQNQNHLFLLEKFNKTVKELEIKHQQLAEQKQREFEEMQRNALKAQEQLQLLTQDPVISKRLLELQSGVQEQPQQQENKSKYSKKGDN